MKTSDGGNGLPFTWLLAGRQVVRNPDHTVVGMWAMTPAQVEEFVDGLIAQVAERGEAIVSMRVPAGAVQYAAIHVQKRQRPKDGPRIVVP